MTLVNKEQWGEAYDEIRQLHPNDDYKFDRCIERMLSALGDDESEALDFMSELDAEGKNYLYSFDEQIVGKYPSEAVRQFIQDEVVAPAALRQSGL
jgi:hypothetical protein